MNMTGQLYRTESFSIIIDSLFAQRCGSSCMSCIFVCGIAAKLGDLLCGGWNSDLRFELNSMWFRLLR